MGKAKVNATTPQGARAAAINLQAHQDSTSVTSVSGFCNLGSDGCYSRQTSSMTYYFSTRFIVLILILLLVYINGV
jgi:hypothetical protein